MSAQDQSKKVSVANSEAGKGVNTPPKSKTAMDNYSLKDDEISEYRNTFNTS
jgi:hypothetical protein